MDMGIPVFLFPVFSCAVLLVRVDSENDKNEVVWLVFVPDPRTAFLDLDFLYLYS